MKFLHTADLHLGKMLYDMPLFAEQKKMLDDIIVELADNSYAALLLSGDIYDRAVPPVQAVQLFGNFLANIRATAPDTVVCIIPGNHDSHLRLAFASEILQHQNIYIRYDFEKLCEAVRINYKGEEADIFFLPFLYTNAFADIADLNKDKKNNLLNSQAEMAAYASACLKKTVSKDRPAILLAHLFTIGGKPSDSERVFVGTAEYVNPKLFSFFSYTALGHLHKPQKVNDRMYYSGSPLAYSFDEANQNKHLLSVEIDCTKQDFPCTVSAIPISPLTEIYRLSGNFDDFLSTSKFDSYADAFLEISLTDNIIRETPAQLLRTKFPKLLHVKQKLLALDDSIKKSSIPSASFKKRLNKQKTLVEQFLQFEAELENTEMNKEKQAVFLRLIKETSNET